MVDKRMAKITIFTLEKLSKTIECICHVPLLIFLSDCEVCVVKFEIPFLQHTE